MEEEEGDEGEEEELVFLKLVLQACHFEEAEEEEVFFSKLVLQAWHFEVVEEEEVVFFSKLVLPEFCVSPPPSFYSLGGDDTNFFSLEGGMKLLFDFFSWYVALE